MGSGAHTGNAATSASSQSRQPSDPPIARHILRGRLVNLAVCAAMIMAPPAPVPHVLRRQHIDAGDGDHADAQAADHGQLPLRLARQHDATTRAPGQAVRAQQTAEALRALGHLTVGVP